MTATGTDTGLTSGSGSDTGPDDGGGGGISYATVRDDVFVPSCGFGSCHGSGIGGLSLTEETTPAELINVSAQGMPGALYVVPGDSDSSYIVQKMEGTAGIAGSVMPTTGVLDPDRVIVVRSWIDGGAN